MEGPGPQSAYIHIPFCSHKCDFCDFAAYAGLDELTSSYIDVLLKEISERLRLRGSKVPLKTIFFGGGTPGYIDPAFIESVLLALDRNAGIAPDAEITLETTPHAVTAEKARSWQLCGINRLSIGFESMVDEELSAVGRDHNFAQAVRGYRIASAFFDNISVDLMYGLPGQTSDSFVLSLEKALELKPVHLSAYGLTIEINSPLLLRFPRQHPAYPSEDVFCRMYEDLVGRCAAFGLQQYEISNFAVPGYECAHNLTYWLNREYYAFGVSAHRYVDGVRSCNHRSLKRYMRDYLEDVERQVISAEDEMKESIMLGLRMRRGLDIAHFEKKFGCRLFGFLGERATAMMDDGLLEQRDGYLRLTDKSVLISNSIIANLI